MAFFERKKHPRAELRNRHLEFIGSNWIKLAVACYSGFKKHGAGFLVIYEADIIQKSKKVMEEVRMKYLPGRSLPDFEEDGREFKWLATYSPETTMLISFLRVDGGLSSYSISGKGDGRPKFLYEKSKSKH
ncbi:MAG: hypothetical protein A2283_24265 [Lentisphaerae bacterium RIFOXYA12_FULL_48_11]|nr:MAG: hypothetical protein A2283_24265 [Lentisphaerae bacterium RIFOXYA12_FULL_48_11]